MDSNENGKHDTCLKGTNNKTNGSKSILKTEKKRSPGKNNAYSKVVTSSPHKQKKKKDSFNKDLDISDKYNDKVCKELNFDNSKNNSVSTSASEEDKDTGKSSKKKDKAVDLLFEKRIEKKKQQAIMYEKYLHRGGARNPGSKEIPTVRNFVI